MSARRSTDNRPPYDAGNNSANSGTGNELTAGMANAPSGPSAAGSNNDAVPDDDGPADTMPLSMSASVMLGALPTDARSALAKVEEEEGGKGIKVRVRFTPVGSAPRVNPSVAKVSAGNRFETVVNFLRRKLALSHDQHVFCYVNSVFAPGLDEGVGGLFKCFKQRQGTEEQLVVAYAMTPAFG